MAAKFLLLLGCLALSHAALVKRETPDYLGDITKNVAEFQKTFTEQFNSIANSKNTQDVNKAVKEGTDTVVQQLTTFSSSLQAALGDATGKAKAALEQSRANIERTIGELRAAHPDVEQQANAVKDKLNAAVQNTFQESQKLAKEISENVEQANQKIAPKIQEAFNDFVKQAQDVGKKLHEAANKQ